MVFLSYLFQVPAPFNQLAGSRKNSDEPKGVDPIKRQLSQCSLREIWRRGRAHRIDDFASADKFAANSRRDGIPVDERKRRTVVVHSNPSSTTGFRWTEYRATVHHHSLRRNTSGARQLFVAVHAEAIASLLRNERDGAHESKSEIRMPKSETNCK